MSQLLWACFSQKSLWWFVSSVVNGPLMRSIPWLQRELCANLCIHTQIRTAFCNWNLCSTSAISFFSFTATPSTFCTSLTSVGFLLTARLVHPLANVLEIQATLVHATTDQLSLHALHDLQDQWDSLLWEHSAMSPLCDCLIFCTRLAMNCLYSPCPRIQYKATELSSQQCVLLTGSPSRASLTLSTRFTAMWPETSSNRGMVSPCLDSLDLAAIRPWLVPDACQMTA